MTIKINFEGIRIRPSAVDGFYNCAYQWGKTFLEGARTIPNARAAIGTSIHKGAEVFWSDAMQSGKKDANLSKLTDAAVEAWKEETNDGVSFDDGENANTAISEIIRGTETFVADITEFTPIPSVVEHFVKVDVTHPLVQEVGGTIDYYCKSQKTLADLKTSKRKATVSNYVTQQSIYKFLAEANDMPVEHNLIQNVVLKKDPEGAILALEPDVAQAKFLVNHMLDVLDVLAQDKIRPEILLPGNPKYYLCSAKYCAQYKTCPFVKGNAPAASAKAVKL